MMLRPSVAVSKFKEYCCGLFSEPCNFCYMSIYSATVLHNCLLITCFFMRCSMVNEIKFLSSHKQVMDFR